MPVDRGSFRDRPPPVDRPTNSSDQQPVSEVDPSVQQGISNVSIDPNILNRRRYIPPPVWTSIIADPSDPHRLAPTRNRGGVDSYRVRLPIRFNPYTRHRIFPASNASSNDNRNSNDDITNSDTTDLVNNGGNSASDNNTVSGIRFVSQEQNTIIASSAIGTPIEGTPDSRMSPLNSIEQSYFTNYDDDSYYNCFNHGQRISDASFSSIIDLQPVVFASNIFKIHMGHTNNHVSELIKEFGLMNFMNDTIVNRRLAHVDCTRDIPSNEINVGKEQTTTTTTTMAFPAATGIKRKFGENNYDSLLSHQDHTTSLDSSFLSSGSSFHLTKEGISTKMKIMRSAGRNVMGTFESGQASLQFHGEIIDFENLDLRPGSRFGIEASIFNNLLRNTLCYDKDLTRFVGRHARSDSENPKWKPFFLTDFGYLKTNLCRSSVIQAPVTETKFPPSSIFHKIEHSCGNKGFCYKSLAKWFDLPPFNDFNRMPAPPTPPGKRRNTENNPENILICSNCQNTILTRFVLMKVEIDIEELLKDPVDVSKDLKIKNDMKFKNRRKVIGSLLGKNSSDSSLGNNNGVTGGSVGVSSSTAVDSLNSERTRGFTYGTLRGNGRNSEYLPFNTFSTRNYLSGRGRVNLTRSYNALSSGIFAEQNPNFIMNVGDLQQDSFNGMSTDSDATSEGEDESLGSVFVYELSSSESDSEDNAHNEETLNYGSGVAGGDEDEDDDEDEDELINVELSSGRSRRLESLLFDTDLTLEQQHHRRKAVSATKLYKNGKRNNNLKLKLFCSINRLTGEMCLVPGNLDKNNWSSDANDGTLFEDSASFVQLYNMFNETGRDSKTQSDRVSQWLMNDKMAQKKQRIQKLLLLNMLTNPRLYNNLSSPSSSGSVVADNEKSSTSIYPLIKAGGYKRSNKRIKREDGCFSKISGKGAKGALDAESIYNDEEDMDEKAQVKILLSRYFSETKSIVDTSKVLVFKPKAQDTRAPINCMGSFYSVEYA